MVKETTKYYADFKTLGIVYLTLIVFVTILVFSLENKSKEGMIIMGIITSLVVLFFCIGYFGEIKITDRQLIILYYLRPFMRKCVFDIENIESYRIIQEHRVYRIEFKMKGKRKARYCSFMFTSKDTHLITEHLNKLLDLKKET